MAREAIELEDDAPVVLRPATKSVRVKGTWTFYFGHDVYDFVDGHHYDLPLDVFDYLRRAGNIYDTMS